MGQVVEVNQRAPRPIASAPNEKQSYQQHVAFQRQFDSERVAYGFQSNSGDKCEAPSQRLSTGENPLDEDGALESIFTTQIAGLAGMMERILAEKKAKESSENTQVANASLSREDNLVKRAVSPPIRTNSESLSIAKDKEDEADSKKPPPTNGEQILQAPVAALDTGRIGDSALPLPDRPATAGSAKQEHGLMQSRWATSQPSAPEVNAPNGHRNSEELIQFSPTPKGPGVFAPRVLLATGKGTPASAASDAPSDRKASVPIHRMNGVDQDNTAEAASGPSFSWW